MTYCWVKEEKCYLQSTAPIHSEITGMTGEMEGQTTETYVSIHERLVDGSGVEEEARVHHGSLHWILGVVAAILLSILVGQVLQSSTAFGDHQLSVLENWNSVLGVHLSRAK